MRLRLKRRSALMALGVVLAACLTCLVVAATAGAERPTPGARYYALGARGQHLAVGIADAWIELRVASSGRRLAGVTIMLDCGDSEFRDMTLPFRGNPQARIARDGSFALAGRRGGRSYRLAGRFLGPQYGRLRYSARMRSSRLRKVCRSGENGDPLALYRNGIPPYGGCRSQRALTLLWSETGRVFQQYRLVGGLHGSGWRPHAYACLFATPHRRVDLGQNYDEATVELPRIAGTLVAHVAATTDIGGGYARLRVLDLSGAPTRVIDATPGGPRDSTSRVWDLVLKPNGSIAWTVFDSGSWPFEPQQVWALDAAGLRQLDSGPGLDLDSLELSESTLTWINGARTRSATLD